MGDIDVARGIEGQSARFVEPCCTACAIDAAPQTGGTGEGTHYTCRCGDLAYRVVAAIANIKVPRSVYGQARREVEMSRAVTFAGHTGNSRQRTHYTRRPDHTDGVIVCIGDVDVSYSIHGHALLSVAQSS